MSESWKRMIGKDPKTKKLMKPITDSIMAEHEKNLRGAIETVDQIDSRTQKYRPRGSWYPISWYGCNLCAPADAQADFVDGAIETATIILDYSPTFGTQEWITHNRTKGYASDIRRMLIERNRSTEDVG